MIAFAILAVVAIVSAILVVASRNPVVSGSILAHLTEAGELVESRGAQAATTKPRFSRSSLVTLQVAEILLHAVAAINAPEARAARSKPSASRRLDRILVTPPSGMGAPVTIRNASPDRRARAAG